jgi:glycosyltransferase involved in cell wall biosynthesis
LIPLEKRPRLSVKDPLISFIIPVYKKPPEVFERCLKSLRDMSYKRTEIIVVFDGTPDLELAEIARKYTSHVSEIEHGGAPKARNAGVKLSTGTYLSFWDADCYAKPDMAKRWMDEFKDTDADFVYSGYEFTGHSGGIIGEKFDPYLLTCNNYIATMFPMKREIFPGFDESLEGAQDWDMWLSIVEKGAKGSYIEGYGFITEPPSADSISGKAWNEDNFRTTHWKVRDKHNIPKRDIVIGSAMEKQKGLQLAKMLGADFSQFMDFRVHDYKAAFNLGFGENVWFANAPADCVKLQYWMPWDITMLEKQEFRKVIDFLERLEKLGAKHLVNEMVSQKRLGKMFEFVGMETPQIIPLPSEVNDAETKLPEKYRVLLDIDEVYFPLFKSIKQDLPYLDIDDLNPDTNPMADITQYSILISFRKFPTIDEGIRRFLINGRNIISNVQAPYCGFFDLEVGMKDFKQELIRRVRDGRFLPFNSKAQEHYKAQVDPKAFAAKINTLIPVEVK